MTALLLALLSPAHAELPMPPFPDCGPDGGCPNDFGGWSRISWIPESSRDSVRPAERTMGSGLSLDRALRHTGGRWDVPVAVLDSGIYWGELPSKVRLNVGELPPPLDADGNVIDDYDLDGNGLVNVHDYAEDPRVDITAGADTADHVLDPSDLIHTFSDGVDDDANGYPDDIAGWDFFGWDNDPYAAYQDGYAHHGTGVMKDAAREGDDGGSLGICPNCAVIPVRVGDTFVTDGDRVGMAIAYAADAGARVVGMAIGSLTHPGQVEAAIEYADSRGVVLVSAAGDENSYHHNLPAAEDPILYVHTVRGSSDEGDGDVYSFLNFANCNNFGPRVDLVVGKADCATGSTAYTTGAAGLLMSAARDVGDELTPDEVRSLLRGTVDDVHLTEDERALAGTYPSKEGWDAFYGYGRLNIGRAVEQVVDADIPPQVRLTDPDWFAWARPDGDPVEIRGHVDAPRTGGVSWRVEVGTGAEPEAWTTIAEGAGPASGVLATLDPSGYGDQAFAPIDGETVVERMYRAHEPMVHVRLVATDDAGRTAEERHGIWIHDDPALLPGFPMDFDASLEPPPVLADLDGDGDLEIVLATAGGRVHVLQHDGASAPGFPVETDVLPALLDGLSDAPAYVSGGVPLGREGVSASPAVGDIDGDGLPEVVVGSLRGTVYAWNHDGTEVDGFPVWIEGRAPDEFTRGQAWDDGVAAAPSLGDVDGDGALEVVVGAMDQRLYVWRGDGELLPGYPLELCHPELCGERGYRILSSPALGDVDGDGDLDAALGTNEVPSDAAGVAYLVDLSRAEIHPGWPQERGGVINRTVLPVLGEGHPAAIALADLDADGDLEIASNAMLGNVEILHHDGTVALELGFVASAFRDPDFTDTSLLAVATSPSFGDLDADGTPDFLMGGSSVSYLLSLPIASAVEYQHGVGAWSGRDGDAFPGWPKQIDDVSFLMAPSVADVTGDGRPEVLYGSAGFFLYAWDVDGTPAPGWPHFTGGWLLGAPAVGDLDGDGFVEVVATTREGHLFAWRTEGLADQDLQWVSAHHDPQNTGNWHTPIPAQAGPPPEAIEASGGCCGRNRADTGSAAALLLPLLWWRRRSRGVEPRPDRA